MTIYYRFADKSFWRVQPPDDCYACSAAEAPFIEAAIREGKIPRLEGAAWILYTPDKPPLDVKLHNLRQERDSRLRSSDWTQMSDSPLDLPKKKLWAAYRSVLRNLPQLYPTGDNVVWPIQPE
jgi:hypothetical protein